MGIDMIVITILCTLHCHNTQKFNAENVQQSIHVVDKAYQQISTVQYSLYTVLSLSVCVCVCVCVCVHVCGMAVCFMGMECVYQVWVCMCVLINTVCEVCVSAVCDLMKHIGISLCETQSLSHTQTQCTYTHCALHMDTHTLTSQLQHNCSAMYPTQPCTTHFLYHGLIWCVLLCVWRALCVNCIGL